MPGTFKAGVSTGSSNVICTNDKRGELHGQNKHEQLEKQSKSKQSNVRYLRFFVGTRVSYGQLGSDTKLCGTPIRGIELPHISVPGALNM